MEVSKSGRVSKKRDNVRNLEGLDRLKKERMNYSRSVVFLGRCQKGKIEEKIERDLERFCHNCCDFLCCWVAWKGTFSPVEKASLIKK